MRSVLVALRGYRDAAPLLVAAACLIATFVHPSLSIRRARVEAVAVIDITQSMNVPDVRLQGKDQLLPRLLAAKAVLAAVLAELPCGSRVGLGVFTEYRTLLLLTPIEVCQNQQELQGSLALIDGRMAWSGASEVAKGLNSGMETVKALTDQPALVFFSDGHEAPPVNPGYRPAPTVGRGEVRGLVVGVGGSHPMPIPKFDPDGVARGEWQANDVLQTDPRSLGRGGSVQGEQMVEPDATAIEPLPGATPGTEHLSSLREAYLQLLASESGLAYQRLGAPEGLRRALESPALAHRAPARFDLRPILGLVALICVAWPLRPRRWRPRRHGGAGQST